MTSSILDWDSLDDNGKEGVEVKDPQILDRAAKSIAQLDTTQFTEEMAKEEALVKARGPVTGDSVLSIAFTATEQTGQKVKDFSDKIMQQAMENIRKEDFQIIGTGGRIVPSEKFVLNSHTDLNQLVPFKHSWSWALYLGGCNNHWVAGEMGLYEAMQKITDPGVLTNMKLALTYLNEIYFTKERLLPAEAILNVYRLTTSPECRQYLLRLCMEYIGHTHAMSEVVEFGYAPKISDNAVGKMLGEFLELSNTLHYLHRLRDQNLDTSGESVTDYLISLMVGLGYVNLVIPFMGVTVLFITSRTNGVDVSQMINLMLRDIMTQRSYLTNFIATAIEEDPTINVPALKHYADLVITEFHDGLLRGTSTDSVYYDVVRLATNLYRDVLGMGKSETMVTKLGQELKALMDGFVPGVSTSTKVDKTDGSGSELEW